MKEKLEALKVEALAKLQEVMDPQVLNDLRVKYLGKKGELTEVLRGMGGLSAEERPVIGQVANQVRSVIEEIITAKQEAFQQQDTQKRLQAEKVDVTLPGRRIQQGGFTRLAESFRKLRIFSLEWAIVLLKVLKWRRIIITLKH